MQRAARARLVTSAARSRADIPAAGCGRFAKGDDQAMPTGIATSSYHKISYDIVPSFRDDGAVEPGGGGTCAGTGLADGSWPRRLVALVVPRGGQKDIGGSFVSLRWLIGCYSASPRLMPGTKAHYVTKK